MYNRDDNKHIKGALLAFVIAQLVYLFFFFVQFPASFRNAVGIHWGALDTIASWLSTLTMLGYCITCLWAVVQLVLRKPGFLLWFQISGAVALGGNFLVYVMRQVAEGWYYDNEIDYYWIMFIMALFWTAIWCMYFARSSRLYSYMGQDDTYLRMAIFTKNVKAPDPWQERPSYPIYPPYQAPQQPQPPVQQAPMAGPPPAPQYPPVPPVNSQPAYPPQQGAVQGYPAPPPQAPVAPQPAPQQPVYPAQNPPPAYQQPPYQPYGQPPAAQPGQGYPGQPNQ